VIALGCDYSYVTPLKETILGGVQHELQVAVDVTRVEEDKSQGEAKTN
jgi:hypothetical protein